MAVTMPQLRAFPALGRTGSVWAAADELLVTQPSVSAALHAPSPEIGAELTERVGRGIRPSAAGEAFAPYAAHVVGPLEEGRRAVAEAVEAGERELRIVAVTTAAEHIVRALLCAFAAEHPEVRLAVDVANRERVFDRLARHDADVAIAGRPPSGAHLQSVSFMDNTMAVIASPEDALTEWDTVDAAALGERTWLLREEGSGTRACNDAFLARHEISPRTLTLGSNGAIKKPSAAASGSRWSRASPPRWTSTRVCSARWRWPDWPERRWYAHRSTVGPRRSAVADFFGFIDGPVARDALLTARAALPAPAAGPVGASV
jgi:DNA-binding transcriptional LysR family regulator